MDSNEALRRLLNIFSDQNGFPRAGAPGGPLQGTNLKVTRVIATGPLPTVATQLVPANDGRRGAIIRNLDPVNTIWYSDDPNVTDQTGATLASSENTPLTFNGPVYIYCISGSPIVEFVEVVDE